MYYDILYPLYPTLPLYRRSTGARVEPITFLSRGIRCFSWSSTHSTHSTVHFQSEIILTWVHQHFFARCFQFVFNCGVLAEPIWGRRGGRAVEW